MVMASHTESVHIPTEKKVSFLRMYLSAFLRVPNQSQIICHIPKKKKTKKNDIFFLKGIDSVGFVLYINGLFIWGVGNMEVIQKSMIPVSANPYESTMEWNLFWTSPQSQKQVGEEVPEEFPRLTTYSRTPFFLFSKSWQLKRGKAMQRWWSNMIKPTRWCPPSYVNVGL